LESPVKEAIVEERPQASVMMDNNESKIRHAMIESQTEQIERLRSYYEVAIKQLGDETEEKFNRKIDILSQSYEREISMVRM
jgi:actin-related protein